MARKLFIAGNWKMHHDAVATAQVVGDLVRKLGDQTAVDVAVCPPFTSLAAAVSAAAGSTVAVGAQNVHWAAKGAFTGESSADMLTALPVTYAIVGHSERRQYFGETDYTVNQRLRAALSAGLKPILCIGETLAERRAGITTDVVERQLRIGLAGVSSAAMADVTVAYEPVWAIGTGETATPEQAQEVHAHIRSVLREVYGDLAEQVRIQYGGSVKPSNVRELMAKPDLDGALVGGASLKADDFSALVLNAVE